MSQNKHVNRKIREVQAVHYYFYDSDVLSRPEKKYIYDKNKNVKAIVDALEAIDQEYTKDFKNVKMRKVNLEKMTTWENLMEIWQGGRK